MSALLLVGLERLATGGILTTSGKDGATGFLPVEEFLSGGGRDVFVEDVTGNLIFSHALHNIMSPCDRWVDTPLPWGQRWPGQRRT